MADLARIKRNVSKMASQNAPIEDIDGYIASEGVSLDDVRNFTPGRDSQGQSGRTLADLILGNDKPKELPYGQPPEGMVLNPETGQMEDLRSSVNPNIPKMGRLNSAALGVGQGTGFNFLDEATAGLSAATGGDYDYDLARMREMERRAAEDHPVAYYGGQIGGAVGTGAGMAAGGMSLGANAIKAGWRLPAVMAASGAEGLGMGGLYGFGAGEGLEDRLNRSETGAQYGFVGGALAPAVISGLSAAGRRVMSPFRSSPERLAAASVLEREGVPLTAGQKTGSDWLRFRESELGGAKAAQMMDDQARAVTDAAMRRAGGRGLADSGNLRTLYSDLSQGFDDISSRNTLQLDRGMAQDMIDTLREYNRVLPSEQRAILGNIAADIGERLKVGNGTMSGRDYQSIRSRLTTRVKNVTGKDNDLASAYRGLRDALDNGMERSINPADAGRWGELRRNWGNLKVLERAAAGGGEDAALGLISPGRLRMAASAGRQGGYARGTGDFDELARAGQAAMTPLPNSGTAQRMAAHGIFSGLAAGGGALAGGVPGLAAGVAAPFLAGRTLMSGPVQRYLSNQAASGQISPLTRAIATAIMTGNASALAGRLPSP